MSEKKFNSIIQLIDYFPDERACLQYLEQMRWPDGEPVCPHCGSVKVWRLKKNYKHFKCGDCDKRFSAKVGTIFEKSLLPMRKWFIAIFLITSSKKGIASLQLAHQINVTQKTAWFMLQRIRHMMSQKKEWIQLCDIVEADEAFWGGYPKKGDRKKDANGKFLKKRGAGTKKPILFGMVQRGGGVIAVPIKERNRNTLHAMVKLNLAPGSVLVTDELHAYKGLDKDFDHRTINHSQSQYSDKEGTHTNTIEGFWGLMKRGFIGVYHKMSAKHLDLYCDEFTFRYCYRLLDDEARFNKAMKQSNGRITYAQLKQKIPVNA